MRQYVFTTRKYKSRYERLHGTAEGRNSAPRLASLPSVSFPGRNVCPVIHCSLRVKEDSEREHGVKRVSSTVKEEGLRGEEEGKQRESLQQKA